jgi:hypothetical protein
MYTYSVEWPNGEIIEHNSLPHMLACVRVANGVEGRYAHLYGRKLNRAVAPVKRLDAEHQPAGIAFVVQLFFMD